MPVLAMCLDSILRYLSYRPSKMRLQASFPSEDNLENTDLHDTGNHVMV